jgi:hypothetical protein
MTRILVITMITIMGFITGYSCGKSHCEKQDNKPTAGRILLTASNG